ncbi:MAG: DNA primase DnaG, partial [Halobacteriota archaeon]
QTHVDDGPGDADESQADERGTEKPEDDEPATLREHVSTVIGGGTKEAVLLDGDWERLETAAAADVFDAVEGAETTPHAVVVDGELTQRVLDVAAQRGVTEIVAKSEGEFVKKPLGVRVRTAAQLPAGSVPSQ